MDEKQQVETADDVQDALASLMAVEPSPGFVARVRQRIAADAGVREWSAGRLVLPALAGAAVVVLGVLLVKTGTTRIVPGRGAPAVATRDFQAAPSVPTAASMPAVAVAVQQEARPTAFVPQDEIVTMQRLLSAAQAGGFEFELVPAGLPVASELSAPEPISVPPIELLSIGSSSSLE